MISVPTATWTVTGMPARTPAASRLVFLFGNLFRYLTEGLGGEDVREPGEKMAEAAARSPRLRERGKLHLAVSRRQRVGLDLLESERLDQRSAQPGGLRGFGPLILCQAAPRP